MAEDRIPLLVSAEFVTNITNISDNMSGKYLLSAIREAQEIRLKGILGSALLARVKALLQSGDIEDYEWYNELRERCRYFLAYTAIAEVVLKVSYKIANAGVVRTTDEHLSAPSYSEVVLVRQEYQQKADYYCYELQKWICANSGEFKELSECDCARISSNLRSSESCGLFLGGVRGKR